MADNIAIIAPLVNQIECDYRVFLSAANSAMLRRMEEFDGEWIRKRLTGVRGEQASLARHLGISTDKLSKTLNGRRSVQPEEIPLLLEFFNERVVSDRTGEAQLLERIARLNKDGQDILRRQLDALLETPSLVRPDQSKDTDA